MLTSIRLYLDEDVSPQVATRLAGFGIDALTTSDAKRLNATDEEQLIFAASERRAIFTHNIRDFDRLAREWVDGKRHHAGIMYAAQRPPAAVARMIAGACTLYENLDDLVISLPVRG